MNSCPELVFCPSPRGCEGIVNLDTIQTGPQFQSLINALTNAAGP
jgi:hypothetical protein